MNGTLYVVATPIGNIRDITLRAIDVLKNTDLIACEDTRHTQTLLDEYSIGTSTTSYHKFNIRQKTKFLIDQLLSGMNIALVSDAGTPGISDPGEELIRAAIGSCIKIEIIPGASAVVSALSISGLVTSKFVFEGFLPSKRTERRAALRSISTEKRTIIFYEAPHRIIESLKDMKDILGEREISVSRELTKKFEETVRGKISDAVNKFEAKPPKGEFVLVVGGAKAQEKKSITGAEKLVNDLISAGLSRSTAAKIAAKHSGVGKNTLYKGSLDV